METKLNAPQADQQVSQGVKQSPIGSLLVDLGKVSEADVERIIKELIKLEQLDEFKDICLSDLVRQADSSVRDILSYFD